VIAADTADRSQDTEDLILYEGLSEGSEIDEIDQWIHKGRSMSVLRTGK
jgi:hypothetical protein